jgi:hypothetical protein
MYRHSTTKVHKGYHKGIQRTIIISLCASFVNRRQPKSWGYIKSSLIRVLAQYYDFYTSFRSRLIIPVPMNRDSCLPNSMIKKNRILFFLL